MAEKYTHDPPPAVILNSMFPRRPLKNVFDTVPSDWESIYTPWTVSLGTNTYVHTQRQRLKGMRVQRSADNRVIYNNCRLHYSFLRSITKIFKNAGRTVCSASRVQPSASCRTCSPSLCNGLTHLLQPEDPKADAFQYSPNYAHFESPLEGNTPRSKEQWRLLLANNPPHSPIRLAHQRISIYK